MKITCNRQELQNAVNIVLKAVPVKTTMPILECILIKAGKNEINLISNDLELGIKTKVDGNCLDEGSVALSSRLFSEIVRKLPDGEVTISTDSENFMTYITCEKAKFNISGMDGEEFPELPPIEKETQVTISQFTLKEMVRQTVFAIADNTNKIILTGELFEIKDNVLRICALDGHRIALRKVELKENSSNIKVIIPGKALSEVSKIISGESEKYVTMSFTDRQVMFEFDNTIVLSRLIEGQYYNVDQMLETNYGTKVRINKRIFLECIERSILLVKENEKKPVIIGIGDESMELKMNTSVGSMNEELSIVKEGNNLLIGVNPKFIMEALRVIDDEEICIYLDTPRSPCFIRNEENSYFYLVLPVNFASAV